MSDIFGILQELCNLPGPAGMEKPVSERVKQMLETYMEQTWTDALGNVIGVRKCWRENAQKLLFDAHIDEIGLVVTDIQEGFLKFAAVGGVDKRLLPAAQVRILSEPPLAGIICALPPHVLDKEDSGKASDIDDMFIDIGLSQEEAERTVPLGTPVVFEGQPRRFGKDEICAKALDNRAGVAAVIYALELLKNETLYADLYVMMSVQEEVGTRGAGPGAFGINPDRCVVVDADFARTPDMKPDEVRNTLGGGVVISKGPNMNAAFTEMAVNLALENGIKHQISVEPGGNSGTNARVIQVTREGAATALFGIPVKYMHSPNEAASLDDIESTARLLCETAKRAGRGYKA